MPARRAERPARQSTERVIDRNPCRNLAGAMAQCASVRIRTLKDDDMESEIFRAISMNFGLLSMEFRSHAFPEVCRCVGIRPVRAVSSGVFCIHGLDERDAIEREPTLGVDVGEGGDLRVDLLACKAWCRPDRRVVRSRRRTWAKCADRVRVIGEGEPCGDFVSHSAVGVRRFY